MFWTLDKQAKYYCILVLYNTVPGTVHLQVAGRQKTITLCRSPCRSALCNHDA